MNKILKQAALLIAMTAASFASISVSSPTNGSSVGSPVHVVASSSSSTAIVAMKVYVDNNIAYSISSSSINAYVNMSGGWHNVVVQSWDKNGYVQKYALKVDVTSTTTASSTSTTTSGTTIYNIDQKSGWQNCGTCAGAGGNGATASHSLTQYVSSPSLDGNSAQFWIGGGTAYADALWWNQLGANSAIHHFVYDLYFYMTNSNPVQALEFDVNQSTGGHKYIMGTQCNVAASQWDVWNTAGAYWVHTGVYCGRPSTYKWHHLTWEVERTTGNQIHFIAVTLDGVKSYINKYYYPFSSSANEINVAFQMDVNSTAVSYSTWIDRMSLNEQ